MSIKKPPLRVIVLLTILVVGVFLYNIMQNKNTDLYQEPYTLTPINTSHALMDRDPVSTNNEEAKEILVYLAGLTESPQVLSGINIGNATFRLEETYKNSVIDLREETGKIPAILSVDYLWKEPNGSYAEVNQILSEHTKKGGLVTINMHPGNPFIGGVYAKGTGSHNFDDLFTPGTTPYQNWQTVLADIGDGLEELEENGVVVLFRPLHEMNGNWFWWSFGESGPITKEEYAKLWLSVYSYFIEERGLTNLLWVYSPNSAHNNADSRDVLELYPGDMYVDIVALDFYEDTLTELNRNNSIEKLLSLGKPFGFAEFGPRTRKGFDNLVIVDELLANVPQTSFLIHWHTNVNELFPVPRSILDNDNAKAYMESESVIARDETDLP